ncbi:uncharacterized protein C9orf40 homolog [Aptenodytes patagonicus]|uniref:uncharacterized protein C9orf40 homolog n=1 Tax=Aptenodytes patagonicus TaxID=9234 RepID=UPI003FA02897
MAKRCAESLMGHVPFKNLLCELLLSSAAALKRSPRSEETSVSCAVPKRKLEEVEAPPDERPGLGGSSLWGKQGDVGDGWRGGPAESQGERTAEGDAGGRGKERGADQQEEGFCQYNSFLYWRAPLPTIDLSDIQDLDGEAAPRAKTSSRTDSTETEMAS